MLAGVLLRLVVAMFEQRRLPAAGAAAARLFLVARACMPALAVAGRAGRRARCSPGRWGW